MTGTGKEYLGQALLRLELENWPPRGSTQEQVKRLARLITEYFHDSLLSAADDADPGCGTARAATLASAKSASATGNPGRPLKCWLDEVEPQCQNGVLVYVKYYRCSDNSTYTQTQVTTEPCLRA